MNFKIFVAVFVGLLAVKASVQSPLKDDDLKEIVVQVLEQILSYSDDLLAKANEAIDNFDKNQDEIKDKIVAYAIDIGKKVNTFIVSEIDKLKDGATDDGKAVLDCIDAEEPKVEDTLTKVFGDIGTCAAGENPLVIAEIKTILSQLNDLKTDVQGQIDTLSSCANDDLTCFLSFFDTIVTTIKKIPTVVTTDIQDIIELVKTIVNDVSGCGASILKEIESDAQTIFNEGVVCIKK